MCIDRAEKDMTYLCMTYILYLYSTKIKIHFATFLTSLVPRPLSEKSRRVRLGLTLALTLLNGSERGLGTRLVSYNMQYWQLQ